MIGLIVNIISLLFPFIGLIGFIYNINYLMIFSIVWSILAFLTSFFKGQKYQLKFLVCLFTVGILIYYIFKLSFIKSLTISIVFPNLPLIIFSFILTIFSRSGKS